VLTRLQENHEPEPVAITTPDALQLNEAPIADTGRYDLLSESLSPIRLAEESADA